MSTNGFSDVIAARGALILDDFSDLDDTMEQLARSGIRPVRLTPEGPSRELSARLQVISGSPSIRFARVRFGAALTVTPLEPEDDTFMYVAPSAGAAVLRVGGSEARFAAGSAGFVAPYREFVAMSSADYDCSALLVDRSRVESLARRLLDGQELGTLEFEYGRDVAAVAEPEVLQLMTVAAAYEAADGDFATEQVRSQLTDIALEAALMSTPSFYERYAQPNSAHGRAVSAAIDFMSANLDAPLSLSQIAASALASPRALQLAFKRETGLSPMRWLRARRLEHAHQLLRSADASHLRITDIALASGFLHMSDFSKRYRERYGEYPSTTWKRSRGRQ